MPHFFIILLKINLVLILFAAAYYLILRRLTFYVINRVFLAFGILFGTIYPFIDLTDFFHKQSPQVAAFVPQVKQLVPSSFIGEYWQWIAALFYAGVVFMAFRLIIQFVSLYRMHKKSAPGSVANFEVRILNEPVGPFSFWQTVYINPSLHQERELQTILEHEQIHVKQWHSLDIILAELSVVFYWFNPGVWLMKKAVKENLEFITDEKILKKGVDKKAYQYSLLDVGNLMPAVEIVNNFNLSDLKKRIKMMNAKRSSKLTLSRYMLVLPVLLLTTLAFTVSKKDVKKHLAPIKQALIYARIIEKDETPAVEKKQTVKKKIFAKTIDITKDTTSLKFDFIVNTINIITDSAYSSLPDLTPEKAFIIARREGLPANVKARVAGMFMLKTDSLGDNREPKVENISIRLHGSEVPVTIADKPYTETVIVRGFKTGTKLPDSATRRASGVIYLNGQKISQEDLNKIKPDEIKNVTIQRAKTIQEVTVVGYGKKTNP
ncbi:M56 family metallopeptidase [Pedobacter frigiditerrae]|uniref:M56 family metallopeptidase n=1 Tax=Pedobacter frigiditerrae TaxID=2530452 RepID=UPI00292D9A11|nr:M56 family metallopeptidase [Pedobacter frigiditerrae]